MVEVDYFEVEKKWAEILEMYKPFYFMVMKMNEKPIDIQVLTAVCQAYFRVYKNAKGWRRRTFNINLTIRRIFANAIPPMIRDIQLTNYLISIHRSICALYPLMSIIIFVHTQSLTIWVFRNCFSRFLQMLSYKWYGIIWELMSMATPFVSDVRFRNYDWRFVLFDMLLLMENSNKRFFQL